MNDWSAVAIALIGVAGTVGGTLCATWMAHRHRAQDRRAESVQREAARLGPTLALLVDLIDAADPDQLLGIARTERELAMSELANYREQLREPTLALQEIALMNPSAAIRGLAEQTYRAVAGFMVPLGGGAALVNQWGNDTNSLLKFQDMLRNRRIQARESVEQLAASVREAAAGNVAYDGAHIASPGESEMSTST